MCSRSAGALKTCVLKPSLLYHGTDCAGDFLIPDGPAWFALSSRVAKRWAGWSDSLPPGRVRGERRVLVVLLREPVVLLDTRDAADYEAMCERLAGDPEPVINDCARAVLAAGYNGWLGDNEVMLCHPSRHLILP